MKKKSNIGYIITTFLLTIVLFAIGVVFVLNTNHFNVANNTISVNNSYEAVKLTYANESVVKSEGVYITDVSEIVDNVMPSIVAITSKTIINSGRYGYGYFSNNSYTASGAGSGVIVADNDEKIFILTNYHVIENASELSVKFIDDQSYDATVVGISERKDIAIVSVNKSELKNDTLNQIKIAVMGNSNELKVGNGVIAIGNALGYGQSVTTGIISALNREITTDNYTQEMIQIDAAINGGNSGGALLNSKGEVIGINSAKYSSSGSSTSASIEGMGFAIPISDVEDLIGKLINGENDKSILLGIEGYMTTSNNVSSNNLPEGFYVTSITKDGNAYNSDLEIGNIITEVDNNKVTSLESIKKVLDQKVTGDKIFLKVAYASGKEYKNKEISITLK